MSTLLTSGPAGATGYMPMPRTTHEKMADAHTALKMARGKLAETLQRKEEAKRWAAEWRMKIDQIEAWIAQLKVEQDAELVAERPAQAANPEANQV